MLVAQYDPLEHLFSLVFVCLFECGGEKKEEEEYVTETFRGKATTSFPETLKKFHMTCKPVFS